MSTYFALLSTLNFDECISRLEEAGKPETMDLFGTYHPLRCEVKRLTPETISFFNLRKRKDPHAMFVFGRLYEVDNEGTYKTLITYSVGDPSIPSDLDEEDNEKLDSVNRNIGMFLLFLLSLVSGYFLGIKIVWAGFTGVSLATIILFSLLGNSLTKRHRNKDVDEMVDFIKKTLEAR